MPDKERFLAQLHTAVFGRQPVLLHTVDSTNDYAKVHRAALAHGTVILADSQTAGRGRLPGRSFVSPDGKGVYMTLVLKEGLTPDVTAHLTVTAAVATARAIERLTPLTAAIKWVNDIVLDGRKVAGLLAEAAIEGDRTSAVLGIGVNVTGNTPPELGDAAVSLEAAGGGRIAVETVAAQILNELETALRAGYDDVLTEYRARSCLIGRRVTVTAAVGAPYEATAEAIDRDGHLVVRRKDGSTVVLAAGEVSVRRAKA